MGGKTRAGSAEERSVRQNGNVRSEWPIPVIHPATGWPWSCSYISPWGSKFAVLLYSAVRWGGIDAWERCEGARWRRRGLAVLLPRGKPRTTLESKAYVEVRIMCKSSQVCAEEIPYTIKSTVCPILNRQNCSENRSWVQTRPVGHHTLGRFLAFPEPSRWERLISKPYCTSVKMNEIYESRKEIFDSSVFYKSSFTIYEREAN